MRGIKDPLPHFSAPTFLPSLVPLPCNVLTAEVAMRGARALWSSHPCHPCSSSPHSLHLGPFLVIPWLQGWL